MEDVFTRSTLFEGIVGRVGQSQGVIEFSTCQQSRVRSYSGTTKFKADFGVKVELDRGLFAVTNEVPPARLRNQKQILMFISIL